MDDRVRVLGGMEELHGVMPHPEDFDNEHDWWSFVMDYAIELSDDAEARHRRHSEDGKCADCKSMISTADLERLMKLDREENARQVTKAVGSTDLPVASPPWIQSLRPIIFVGDTRGSSVPSDLDTHPGPKTTEAIIKTLGEPYYGHFRSGGAVSIKYRGEDRVVYNPEILAAKRAIGERRSELRAKPLDELRQIVVERLRAAATDAAARSNLEEFLMDVDKTGKRHLLRMNDAICAATLPIIIDELGNDKYAEGNSLSWSLLFLFFDGAFVNGSDGRAPNPKYASLRDAIQRYLERHLEAAMHKGSRSMISDFLPSATSK